MNPIHRGADRSARLHLFQELSTLAQQFAHTPLLRQGRGGVLPMFPASMPRPLQPFGGSRSGAGTAVHSTSSIGHSRGLTCGASAGLGSAPWGGIWVSDRIAIFQPARSFRNTPTTRLSFHRVLHPFQDPDGLRVLQLLDHRQRCLHFLPPSAGGFSRGDG
jgi:hypothetical protein